MPLSVSWLKPNDSWSDVPSLMSLLKGIHISEGVTKLPLVSRNRPCDIRAYDNFSEVPLAISHLSEARGSTDERNTPSAL